MSIHTIMTADNAGEELVTFARDTAIKLVKADLRTNQIRNIFTEVRQIEALWDSENPEKSLRRLNMLKPKMAYQTARERKVKGLAEVLEEAITEVVKAADKNAAFKRFMDLFEAILAYHKAEGARN